MNSIMVQIKNVQVPDVEGVQDTCTDRGNNGTVLDGFETEVRGLASERGETRTNNDSLFSAI